MSDEKIRIAIAEMCGWVKHKRNDRGNMEWMSPNGTLLTGTHTIPDYLNDLNAMHEAEKWLMKTHWEVYKEIYIRRYMDCHQFNGVSATANERAHCFVKTLEHI